jgi:ADP-heptose:LPS heptosyltransferase
MIITLIAGAAFFVGVIAGILLVAHALNNVGPKW